MDRFFLTSMIFLFFFAGIHLLVHLNEDFKRSYHYGISLWALLLPTLAILVISTEVSFSMLGLFTKSAASWNLFSTLNKYELVLCMSSIPLMCLPFGYLFSFALSVYLTMVHGVSGSENLGLLTTLISLNILTVLHPHLPWFAAKQAERMHRHFREVISSLLAIAILALSFFVILQSSAFSSWIAERFASETPREVLVIFLVCGMFLWVSITLGMARAVLYPLIAIPTVFVCFFLFAKTTFVLAIASVMISLWLVFAANRTQNDY